MNKSFANLGNIIISVEWTKIERVPISILQMEYIVTLIKQYRSLWLVYDEGGNKSKFLWSNYGMKKVVGHIFIIQYIISIAKNNV